MKIADALHIPEFSDLSEFIARLNDDEAKVQANLRSFVVPANLEAKLDKMLAAVGHNLDQQQDVGRYIYGTFGSGKSHLMTVLAKMLERDETVYDVGDEALRRLRAKHPWLDQHRTLVVRVNMMGKRSLSSALFEGYNHALPEGIDPVVFTDEDEVFRLFELDAEKYGGMETHLQRLVDAEIIPSPGFYERMRVGAPEERIDLAARIESWRNHGREIRPEDLWVDPEEGFSRIARHAKAAGYTAITWMIDELVIWIRGRNASEYVDQINQLSSLVDHDRKSDRPTPFFVAVAVQQDIATTCPQDVSEQAFREQLGFIANRFRPQLDLEDQDLFEVASRRVLKPKSDVAETWNAKVKETLSKHKDEVQKRAGNVDPELIRNLYPFHPALMRIMVDVTQGLSRSRSAMSALYGLLKDQQDLEVGHFIPVGALFDILFTTENIESVRNRTQSALANRLVNAAESYERLKPRIDRSSEASSADPNELHQLMKTCLLCQLSDRDYFGTEPLANRTQASFLLHLNQSDVRTAHPRLGLTKVVKLFKGIDSTEVAVGEGSDPVIRVQTDKDDSDAVLNQALGELEHADEFAYLRTVIDEVLGLGVGTTLTAKLDVGNWRGTKRKGRLRLANVRTLSYAGKENEFAAGEDEFLILVDYPFDEDPTKSRKDDIEQCQRARERGRQWTVAWLPDHLAPSERNALKTAASIERVRKDKRRFLDNYSPREADRISRSLEHHQATQRNTLEQAIRRVYVEDGEVHALSELLDGVSHKGKDVTKVPAGLASDILDARYPNHPRFTRRVSARDLETLAELVVRATVTGQAEVKGPQMELVHAFAVPLEMVYPGTASVSKRPDGRYLQKVHEAVGNRQRFPASLVRDTLTTDGKDGLGFTDEVVRFFLYYLLHAEGYAAQSKSGSLTIQAFRDLPSQFDLLTAQVVDSATWDHARHADSTLFGGGRDKKHRRADIPSVPEQDKLSREMEEEAGKARKAVTSLRCVLGKVLEWAGVAPEDSDRARTLSALENVLVELSDRKSPFERVEAMAKVGADAELSKRYGLVLSTVQKETQALERIGAQQLAFEQVRDRGTEQERKDVVLALTNRLKGPVSASLSDLATGWPDVASSTLKTILKREEVTDPDEEKKRLEETRRQQEAEKQRLEETQKRLEEEARQRAAENAARQRELEKQQAELAAKKERVALLDKAPVHAVKVAEAKQSAAGLIEQALSEFGERDDVEIQIVVRKRTS